MAGEYKNLPDDLASLQGFRVNDLVAKVAGVSLKNTTRVLLAAELVCWLLDKPIEDVVDGLSSAPATAENWAACARAAETLNVFLAAEGDTSIRQIRRIR
jgi:hypothetical protein